MLQHVAVPVIENQVCESWHRRKGIDIRIYDEMMCAGYELGQRDACQGDSGGPLMLNQFGVWYLVGIVSAGYSCAKQYQPGIYHRVSENTKQLLSKPHLILTQNNTSQNFCSSTTSGQQFVRLDIEQCVSTRLKQIVYSFIANHQLSTASGGVFGGSQSSDGDVIDSEVK